MRFAHREEAWTLFMSAVLSRSTMDGRAGASITECATLADKALTELEIRVKKWRAEDHLDN